MNSGQLFRHFNNLMMEHGLEPYPEGWYTNMRMSFQGLIDWCRDTGVDPARWMMAKHAAINWRFRMGPKKLMRTSAKFLAQFEDWGDTLQVEEQSQTAMLGTAIDAAAHTGPTYLSEAIKATFVIDRELCMLAIETVYDSASKWCLQCPARWDCHARG